MPRRRVRTAFTLIELLVVIAILAVLIGLLLPAVQKAREAAARAQCKNNLHQMALALHGYHDAYRALPAGVTAGATANFLSFHVDILPYLEQENLYRQFNLSQRYDAAGNLALGLVKVPNYQCPSATQLYTLSSSEYAGGQKTWTNHYYGVAGPLGINPQSGAPYAYLVTNQGNEATQGVLGLGTRTRLTDVKDGASNTLMLGELSWTTANSYRVWSRGTYDDTSGPDRDLTCCRNVANAMNSTSYNGSNNWNNASFGSMHDGGAHFALCDGSVRFLQATIGMNTYLSAASKDGGEALQLDP
jgi:prepilin-type N-terminal cleavage/methylation domain-containing protein/prepilin-type processing-associated H-X9-DG protein